MSDQQPDSAPATVSTPSDSAVLALYSALTGRRATFDTLMWQVPVLGLTAQAFLLTIGLGQDTSRAARIVSGGLAFLIAAISMQTMHKWRQAEVIDSILIERLEIDRLNFHLLLGVAPHSRLSERAEAANRKLAWWAEHSSYRLWIFALSLFAAAALLIVGTAVAHAKLF